MKTVGHVPHRLIADKSDKQIRSILFDICNEKKLSATITEKIMTDGQQHFRASSNGEVFAIGNRWKSPMQYVHENSMHIETETDKPLAHSKSLSEKDKLFLIMDDCAKSGNMRGYRTARRQYRDAIG